MQLFEDDIRGFDESEDINIIDIKCKLLRLHFEGNSEAYLRGFVDCIAKLQLICMGDWEDLLRYITNIQACN